MRKKRPFPHCLEPHYESEAKCKAFHVKISFVGRLAFITKFKVARKWPIRSYHMITLNETDKRLLTSTTDD